MPFLFSISSSWTRTRSLWPSTRSPSRGHSRGPSSSRGGSSGAPPTGRPSRSFARGHVSGNGRPSSLVLFPILQDSPMHLPELDPGSGPSNFCPHLRICGRLYNTLGRAYRQPGWSIPRPALLPLHPNRHGPLVLGYRRRLHERTQTARRSSCRPPVSHVS